jgi:hypothetical protein
LDPSPAKLLYAKRLGEVREKMRRRSPAKRVE